MKTTDYIFWYDMYNIPTTAGFVTFTYTSRCYTYGNRGYTYWERNYI